MRWARLQGNRGVELGALGQMIRGELRPPSPVALDLTRAEFSIPKAGRPFISPKGLIWYGLPGEETQISRLYFARTDSYEAGIGVDSATVQNTTGMSSDDRYVWAAYILKAMRDGKRWLSDSGVWGGKEYRGLRGFVEILDEWIRQQEQIVALTTRQIQNRPSGSYPDKIRSVEHWENYAIIPRASSPGMTVRWPIEVNVLANSLLYELKWAREAFYGLSLLIASYVDCTATNRDGICTEVVANSGGSAAMEAYENAKFTFPYLSGSPGLPVRTGPGEFRSPSLDPALGEVFDLYRDVVNYIGKASGLLADYRELQQVVVSAVKSAIDQIASGIRGGLDQIQGFADTVQSFGNAIPIMGAFISAVAGIIGIAISNAEIDAAKRRERGMPVLYRGVKSDGVTGEPLLRTDIETYALMMYRAMKLQEVRVLALVDGTSSLTGALSPKAVGTVSRTVILRPAAPVSPGGSTALLVGGGVATAALVWWLIKRRR